MWTGPACHEGLLYYSYPQSLFVLDAETGEHVVDHKKNRFGYTGSHAPNTVVAGGYFFAGNAIGQTLVVETGREGRPVALNQLVSELHRDHVLAPLEEIRRRWWDRGLYPMWSFQSATPFFRGDRMYVRTYEHLYCIGPADRTGGGG
jgi:hypothetical protein